MSTKRVKNAPMLPLHEQVEALSRKHPRLGYRKLTRTLRRDGWNVGRKLVQRIRRECGLRVKRWMRRPRRRGRSTGTIPTRAERLNHVWSWDFIADRTDNGGKLRILSLLDEYSRECLALHVARKLTAQDLIDGHGTAHGRERRPRTHPQRQRKRVLSLGSFRAGWPSAT